MSGQHKLGSFGSGRSVGIGWSVTTTSSRSSQRNKYCCEGGVVVTLLTQDDLRIRIRFGDNVDTVLLGFGLRRAGPRMKGLQRNPCKLKCRG